MSTYKKLEEIEENTEDLLQSSTVVESSIQNIENDTGNILSTAISSEAVLNTIETNTRKYGYGSLGFMLEARRAEQVDFTRLSTAYFGGNGFCDDTRYNLILNNAGLAPVLTSIRTPGTGGQIWINSTSANDNIAGTGARVILFDYIDNTGVRKTGTPILMNGLTLRASTETDICNLAQCLVVQAGSSGHNEGFLRIYHDAGGTLLHLNCNPQCNSFPTPFFHIPAGSTFYPTKLNSRLPSPSASQEVDVTVAWEIPGQPKIQILQVHLGDGSAAGDFDAVSGPAFVGNTVVSLRARRVAGNGTLSVVSTMQGFVYT